MGRAAEAEQDRRCVIALRSASVRWNGVRPHSVPRFHALQPNTDRRRDALAQRHANAAREYLVRRDIAADRIDVASFCEERPVCEADT